MLSYMKSAGRRAVGLDASHARGGQKHKFRTLLREEGLDVGLARKVELGVGARHYVLIALPAQFPDYGRAHHSAVAGHIYF